MSRPRSIAIVPGVRRGGRDRPASSARSCAVDPRFDVLVVDDALDATRTADGRRGRRSRRGAAAVQPRHRRHRADRVQGGARAAATTSPSDSTATASTTRPSWRSCSARSSATRRTSSRARGSSTATAATGRPLARRLGIVWFAWLVSLAHAPPGDRHDVRLPGAQPARHRAVRRGLPAATTRRWSRPC